MAQPCHADPSVPFPPFLRYDTYEKVDGTAKGTAVDADHTSGAAAPIPVARLAAAKSTARKVYLDSLLSTTAAASNAATDTQKLFSSSAPPSAAGGKRAAAAGPAAPKSKSRAAASNFGIKPFHVRDGTAISHPRKTSTKGAPASATTKAAPRKGADDSSSGAAAAKKDNLPNVMKHTKDAKQILFTIFPPVTVDADGADDAAEAEAETGSKRKLVLQVSTQPTSREEVAVLHQALLKRLATRRARPTGLCPIRREIYQDLFQELIRQITLEEPARGVLTQRLRDELESSVELHADLLARGDYFVSRKLNSKRANLYANAHVVAEDAAGSGGDAAAAAGKHYGPGVAPPPPEQMEGSREQKIQELLAEKQALDTKKFALHQKLVDMQKQFEEEAAQRHKHNVEELNYLRRINQQLSLRLKIETERVSGANAGGGTQPSAPQAAAAAPPPQA